MLLFDFIKITFFDASFLAFKALIQMIDKYIVDCIFLQWGRALNKKTKNVVVVNICSTYLFFKQHVLIVSHLQVIEQITT